MPGIAPTPLSPHITLIITIQVLLQSTSSRSYALSVLNVLVAASKLKSSRTFHSNVTLQFETKEAADWFKQPDILLSILPRIDSSAKLKNRAYQILVPRVPVTFKTNSEDSLRELEEQNGMKDSVLLKAWWIKLTYRRALVLQFSFPTAILHRYVGLPLLPISPIPLCYVFIWPYYTDMLDCSFSFLTHPFIWPLSAIWSCLYNTDLAVQFISCVWYDLTACLVQYPSLRATTMTTTSIRGVQIPIYLVIRTTDSLHRSAVVFNVYH